MKSAVPLIPLPSRCVLCRPFPEILLQCVLNITGRVLPASADPLMILILMQRWHLLHLRPPRVSPITFSETPELLKLIIRSSRSKRFQEQVKWQASHKIRKRWYIYSDNTSTHAKAGMRVWTWIISAANSDESWMLISSVHQLFGGKKTWSALLARFKL